jgi:hypothetical protein
MVWQFYMQVWDAGKALKAAVSTAWLVKGGKAFAVVRFPQVAKPGRGGWVEKA